MKERIGNCKYCGDDETRMDVMVPGILCVVCNTCGAHGPTAYNKNDAVLVWNATPNTYEDIISKTTDAPHTVEDDFEYYLTTHQHYNKPPEIIALLREAFIFAWESATSK